MNSDGRLGRRWAMHAPRFMGVAALVAVMYAIAHVVAFGLAEAYLLAGILPVAMCLLAWDVGLVPRGDTTLRTRSRGAIVLFFGVGSSLATIPLHGHPRFSWQVMAIVLTSASGAWISVVMARDFWRAGHPVFQGHHGRLRFQVWTGLCVLAGLMVACATILARGPALSFATPIWGGADGMWLLSSSWEASVNRWWFAVLAVGAIMGLYGRASRHADASFASACGWWAWGMLGGLLSLGLGAFVQHAMHVNDVQPAASAMRSATHAMRGAPGGYPLDFLSAPFSPHFSTSFSATAHHLFFNLPVVGWNAIPSQRDLASAVSLAPALRESMLRASQAFFAATSCLLPALAAYARRMPAWRAREHLVGILGLRLTATLVMLFPLSWLCAAMQPLPWFGAALAALCAAILWRLSKAPARWLLLPARGRWTQATSDMQRGIEHATHLDDVAWAMLTPLRKASSDFRSSASLWTFSPDIELRLDLAGMVQRRSRQHPLATLSSLERRTEIGLWHPFRRAAFAGEDGRREPAGLGGNQRCLDDPLAVALHDERGPHGPLLAIAPLMHEQTLVGALWIPRGNRNDALRALEIEQIQLVCRSAAARISMLLTATRAVDRIGTWKRQLEDAQASVETLQDALACAEHELQARRRAGVAGRKELPWVAHSASMQEFAYAARRCASTDHPVLIASEPGNDVDGAAWFVHAHSAAANGPWISVDCTTVHEDEIEAALFGGDGALETHQGWLRMAAGGTLVLHHVPALPEQLQVRLAQCLGTRTMQQKGRPDLPLTARIIGTCLAPRHAPDGAARLHANLRAWFQSGFLRLPPLRKRREDIDSLVLMEVTRASRMLARPLVGVGPNVMQALRQGDWPGNMEALRQSVWEAVARTTGTQMTLDMLPDDLRRPQEAFVSKAKEASKPSHPAQQI